jgi:hypothetical protein
MSEDNAKAFVGTIKASAIASAAPTPAQQLHAFRARVQAILAQELKVEVTWTPRRDLQFVIEEAQYRFLFDDDEPLYVAVNAGAIAACAYDAERNRAIAAAALANRRVKVGKVYVVPIDGRWLVGASAEVLLPAFAMVDKAFVKRVISMLRSAIGEYFRNWEATAGA